MRKISRTATSKYGFWLAGSYEDWSGSKVIADDGNQPSTTGTYDSSKTHHGNILNGEATLSPRYRWSIRDRANNSEFSNSTNYLASNDGISRWATLDPIRLGKGENWGGRAQLQYPNTLVNANRVRYNKAGNSNSDDHHHPSADIVTNTDTKLNSQSRKREITFRMGYMGHVIIICQALVHACGAMDQVLDNHSEGPKLIDAVMNGDDTAQNESPNKSKQNNQNSEEPSNSFKNQELSPSHAQRNMILSLLKRNWYYVGWTKFVATTLASETAVQSTPLGGYNAHEEINAADQQNDCVWEESRGNLEDVEDNSDNFGGYPVSTGDIDLDDTDLDIAASMINSLNIPASDETSNSNTSGAPRGHNRQRGVIAGQGIGNGAAFGTVVEMHKKPNEYVYDDPLGARHHFDDDVLNDVQEENGDNDDSDEDDGAPVMDLFAGNFNFDNAIEAEDNGASDWANFDDADFGSNFADDSKEPINGESESDADADADPFGATDVFGIVSNNSTKIISSLENLDDQINDHDEKLNETGQNLKVDEEDEDMLPKT